VHTNPVKRQMIVLHPYKLETYSLFAVNMPEGYYRNESNNSNKIK